MRATIKSWALVFSLVLALPALAQDFRVIVNPSAGIDALTKEQVSAIFLKKTTKLPNGTSAVPVDQAERSPVRGAFSHEVHQKSVSGVLSYWQQRIFSGRDVPPTIRQTDAEVVAFVKQTPGAIGYVSASADVGGVKVVTLKD